MKINMKMLYVFHTPSVNSYRRIIMRKNKHRITIESTEDIEEMIKILRSKHTVNISAFIRKAIIELYNKLEM